VSVKIFIGEIEIESEALQILMTNRFPCCFLNMS